MAKKETEEVKQEQTPETAEAPKEPPKDASPEETREMLVQAALEVL